ncbi:MAG: AAA family ATPase [Saprospiraceae bacterium]|nr:AAA family ATPase [Saprospiraceae bacterium]
MVDRLYINNYKSLVDFELTNIPNFCVFAGANGTGKSNIFEALQFLAMSVAYVGSGYDKPNTIEDSEEAIENYFLSSVYDAFGGIECFLNKRIAKSEIIKPTNKRPKIEITLLVEQNTIGLQYLFYAKSNGDTFIGAISHEGTDFWEYPPDENERAKRIKAHTEFQVGFNRLFVDKSNVVRSKNTGNIKLSPDASNLGKVLDRILQNSEIKEEVLNWLSLLIPEFENIKIEKGLDGDSKFYIKEKHTETWFSADLISDGTKAILALLTVVYQSDEPQFICIEEPENGLNPYVQKQMVEFFRLACENFGHTIWLNTHSQTIVKELEPQELVLIDKVEGRTIAKQFSSNYNMHGLDMDQAWLSNALGGGVPW